MSGVFDPVNTAKAVHDTLDEAFLTIPSGKRHVFMLDGTVDASGGSARLLYAQRIGDGWNVVLQSRIDTPNGLGARVATMKSW